MTEPIRVLVCGSGFGRIYCRALGDHPEYEVVGLFSRGSDRSLRVAAEYGLRTYSTQESLPQADIACVALRPEAAATVVPGLLDSGMQVLIEHPISEAQLTPLLARAAAHERCLHVNSHFADITHIADFLRRCRESAARERPLWISGVCSWRTRFSLIDMLFRICGPDDHEHLTAMPTSGGVGRSFVGTLGGVPLRLIETGSRSRTDDGSDQHLGHRITIAFPSETLTLVDTWGPIVSTRAMRDDWSVEPRAQDTVRTMRDSVLQRAVNALWEESKSRQRADGQTPAHLVRVARMWDQTKPRS